GWTRNPAGRHRMPSILRGRSPASSPANVTRNFCTPGAALHRAPSRTLVGVIDVRQLGKAFGDRVLFRNASLRIGARDRVALVGPNGSGKTTLVEMVAGIQQPDAGKITAPKDAVIGYLPQETDALRGKTVLAEVLSAGQAMTEAGHRLEVLQRDLAETEDPAERDRLLKEFGHLQSRFEALGGYSLEADAARICAGLGFREEDLGRK